MERHRFPPLLVLLFATVLTGFCCARQTPKCSAQSVTYTPFDQQFADRMTVLDDVVIGVVGDRQFSPQKTRSMVTGQNDYSKPGPWSTVVSINAGNKNPSVLLTFKDHGNGGVHIEWLNEKLLFGTVWWGRIVSTDFIFDVESRKFVYREMANYGELIQPCQR